MNGPQHYVRAEELLAQADECEAVMRQGDGADADPLSLRLAAIGHGLLGLTAATASETLNRTEWYRAILCTTEQEDPGPGVLPS